MLCERRLGSPLMEAGGGQALALGEHRGLCRRGWQRLALRHELQRRRVCRGRVVCGQGAQGLECGWGRQVGIHGKR